MGIQVNAKNRSDAYIGTFSYECADDMLSLANLRDMVSNMNRMLREDGRNEYQFRVCLRGRRPVNSNYDYFGNIVGGLAKASEVDAYIYRR